MGTDALLGILGGILVLMFGLLINMIWDLKKDVREMKGCINAKVDKVECNRLMDKLEGKVE